MTRPSDALVALAAGHVQHRTPAEVEAHLYARAATLIDLREPDELDDHGLIAGAHHVPRGVLEAWADRTLGDHWPAVGRRDRLIVYCSDGRRSALAAATLTSLGFTDVQVLAGGLEAWVRAGLPVAGLKSWHHRASEPPATPLVPVARA